MNIIRKITLLLLVIVCQITTAQTVRQVLDKVAATVENAGGVTAAFSISNTKIQARGTIALKGKKFQVTTPHGITWFDGKTQWTYVKQNDEVNVSTPTEAQLQQINPYTFLNLYKKGYNLSLDKKAASTYEVHLKAASAKSKLQEVYVVVNKKNYVPSQIKMLRDGKWTTIAITDFKKAKLNDNLFRFNAKDYPSAEVIDLR